MILAVLLGLMLLLSYPVCAAESHDHRILALFSFHSNQDWTTSIRKGLEARFGEHAQNTEIIYEYMDARRYQGREFEQRLCSLIRYKYAYQPLDAIVTAHNFAFNYLSDRRDWFSSTPWIFCAVDDQVYSDTAGNLKRSTGLTIVPDLTTTIETALRLHPDRRQLFVVVDNARTRQPFLITLDALKPKLADRAEIQLIDAPSLKEFKDLLISMPSDGLLLILTYSRDRHGDFFPFRRVRKLLSDHSHVPAYTLWENQVGPGIIGGKVITFEDQGRGAADLALRVIHGERPEAIPVVRGQPNRYLFDDREIKRFAVPVSALPRGSVVINQPPSFYTVNKRLIWLLLGGLLSLGLFTLFLIRNVLRCRKAEEALRVSAERLESEHEQRKRLSQRLIDLLEMDRRDVARELHDHIGQILTTMKLDLAAFRKRLVADRAENEPLIAGAEEKLGQVMKGIKDTARGLRPVALELHGLKPALESLATDIEQSSGLAIHFYCGELPGRFDAKKELALFRIAQESLNNAVKHAGARHVHVNLIQRDQWLSLSIEDDGGGFDAETLLAGGEASRSLGLILMRERALQVGGTFQVNSRVGHGAHVLAEVPLT